MKPSYYWAMRIVLTFAFFLSFLSVRIAEKHFGTWSWVFFALMYIAPNIIMAQYRKSERRGR